MSEFIRNHNVLAGLSLTAALALGGVACTSSDGNFEDEAHVSGLGTYYTTIEDGTLQIELDPLTNDPGDTSRDDAGQVRCDESGHLVAEGGLTLYGVQNFMGYFTDEEYDLGFDHDKMDQIVCADGEISADEL